MSQVPPALTVIIPVCDRIDILLLCLRSFTLQTVRDFEVIIVDNGSRYLLDTALLDEYLLFPIMYLRMLKPNARASARNLGIEHARSQALLFWDADMIANPELIRHHVELHSCHGGNIVVVGRRLHVSNEDASGLLTTARARERRPTEWIKILDERASPDRRDDYFRSIDWSLYNSAAPWRAAITCNLSVRTALVRAQGGFDPAYDGAYGYEDLDLAYRLHYSGARFVLQARAIGYHIDHPPLSGNAHRSEKLRNLALFRSKYPEAGVWW